MTDKTMSQQKSKKIVLNIGGMSCVNCARAIEKQLFKLNGVTKATVNLAAEKAIVEYTPDVVNFMSSVWICFKRNVNKS